MLMRASRRFNIKNTQIQDSFSGPVAATVQGFRFCWLALLAAGWVMPAEAAVLDYVLTDAKSTASNGSTIIGSAEMVYNSTVGSTTANTSIGGPTLVESGTANTLGLFSSFDQTSANAGGFNASSFASADLPSLAVKAAVSVNTALATATSNAVFNDTLTFNTTTPTNITVTYALHAVSLDFTGGGGSRTVDYPLIFGSAEEDPQWNNGGIPTLAFNFGWVSTTFTSLDPANWIFTGVYQLTGSHPVVGVTLGLNLSCNVVCVEDYSGTGLMSLSVPAGVSYTSASGVFGTSPAASGVPEPGTLALMVFGLAGVVLGNRRLRAVARPPA